MNTAKKIVYLESKKFLAKLIDFDQAYNTVKADGEHDPITGAKAFAFLWMVLEAGALGKNPQDALNDPALAVELDQRLERWFIAGQSPGGPNGAALAEKLTRDPLHVSVRDMADTKIVAGKRSCSWNWRGRGSGLGS